MGGDRRMGVNKAGTCNNHVIHVLFMWLMLFLYVALHVALHSICCPAVALTPN